ncbi:hemicentin-2 isoform X1 [Dicentrarchus labrax]|uniref:hemicentin-2 isoform X1 n=1 Tax=Dicentrarchus labrax TaxID=13489 RepID=UPI0021F646E4|nr:hemicentin-2 isoform X1 [Dicentrarchus labrax]
MAVWDKKILWGFMLMLAGAGGYIVNYPHPVCAVKGSTVTLLCSFTPRKTFTEKDGREVPLGIVRVVWCQNNVFCHGTPPSVYNSGSTLNDPHYKYLGDKKGNCTLQIKNVQTRDEATFRFRMETNDTRGHFTSVSGVDVTVTDCVQMRIISSSADGEMRRGESVTLYCTAVCTIHQLEVTWFKDNHALSESGPALQLGPLTAKDSGNYICGLRTGTLSLPYSLHVEAEDPVRMKINSSSADGEMRGGESVTLYCTGVCTIHQLEVTWFKDNHALSESGPALQLGPLTAKDSGNYTCGLSTNTRTVSLPYSLHVEDEDPVRMKINSSSADGEMRGGESVTLYCTAVCTIHQLEVTWFKDNHVLSESGPALQLGPLTAKDSGNYTCGLRTSNRTVSLPYSLHVEDEDPVRMKINSSSADGEMRRGESVTLYCTAVCTIHQLEVTWFKDNHALSESGPALQLGPLTAKDSGNYTCGLRTGTRTVSLPYSLHVEDEDPVRMKINSSSADGEMRGGESVTLYCTAVNIHQLEVTWFKDNHALSESGPALQLGPLTAKDSGNYTCGLRTSNRTVSLPYSLHVEDEDPVRMKINSSSADGEMRGGESVTLYCTAVCTIHQLEVTWFKDNHALSESGPALQLGPLTAKDSGNYICGLRTGTRTVSLPYSLHVEAEGSNTAAVVVRLVDFTLHTVLIVIVASIVIKRTCLPESRSSSRELKKVMVQPPAFMEDL